MSMISDYFINIQLRAGYSDYKEIIIDRNLIFKKKKSDK